MPIGVTVTGAEEVKVKFAAMPANVHNALLKAVGLLSLDLERHVKQDKLEGQVLRHITGRLQGSIHSQQPPADNGTTIIGRVYSANCNYAAIHEYGFQGSETVKAHIRTHLFGRDVAPFMVPSFTRTVNMPERSFLRSSLKDFSEKITTTLEAAARKAMAS